MRNKKLLLLLLIPFILAFSSDNDIWSEGHHKKLGRIDSNGIIYDFNEKEIGRIRNGIVYNDPYGGNSIGRIEENNIFDSAYGGRSVGRWEEGRIYNKSNYGGQIVGLAKNPKALAYFLLMGRI